MESKKKILYWLPAISYMALIFVISSYPVKAPVLEKLSDKLIHVVEYAVLVYLIAFALYKTTDKPRFKIEAIAIIITILYGISDEMHQYFVPERVFDVLDAAADTIGALSIFFLRFSKRIWKSKKTSNK